MRVSPGISLLLLLPLALLAPATAQAQALTGTARASQARQIRIDAANFQYNIPLPAHPDNGDEARYPSRFASYTKGLPHDSIGEVNTTEYNRLLTALASGEPADFEAIGLGGVRQLVNPEAAYSYQLEGADPLSLAIRPAPAFSSHEASADMEELYWMFLLRDEAFSSYTASTPPQLVTDAAARLNELRNYRGPKQDGLVTPRLLFRDILPGSQTGPFVSQFLLQEVPYGAQRIEQRIQTRVAGDDRVFTFSEWLDIQNGELPSQPPTFDTTRRYIRNGRDLAEFVHSDFPLQATLNAALILARQGDTDADPKASPLAHDENNPYRAYLKQEAFITFGNSDGQDHIGRIVNEALRGQWFQKWRVHRRLRPEEYGGRIHNQKMGVRSYPIPSELLQSPVFNRVYLRNRALNNGTGTSFLLSQAYPEGSPLHPTYGSGHSTYVGAGVTMLKAFYKVDQPVQNPVQPSADGLSLEPYTGPALTVGDELDKLAANVGLGRLFAGVHYRSDHEQAVRLGELIALRALQDLTRRYNESFPGFQVRTFGGNTLTITPTAPSLPNHVSAVVSFTLIDADTDQPVPGYETLLNNAVINTNGRRLSVRANTYPAQVGSVRYGFNGTPNFRTENTAPYALFSESNGDYTGQELAAGTYEMTATPYSASSASGLGGAPLTIRFTIQ